MKHFLFIIVILISTTSYSQQEKYDYKFTYKVTTTPSKLDLSKKITQELTLLVGTNKSMFISPIKIKIDSARSSIRKRGGTIDELNDFRNKFPKNYESSFFVKTKKTNEIEIFTTHVPSIVISYKEPIPKFNWEISTKQKTILGYPCTLATLSYKGRNYDAWFSTEIPIQNGPWKFSNLPGLIFEIYDLKKQFSFELIGIKKENNNFPLINNKVVQTTKENIQKVVETEMNKFVSMAIGDSKVLLKKKIKELNKKIEARNLNKNHIELEE